VVLFLPDQIPPSFSNSPEQDGNAKLLKTYEQLEKIDKLTHQDTSQVKQQIVALKIIADADAKSDQEEEMEVQAMAAEHTDNVV
jgi:hypothetical protein